jgi:raffinose/stachyose/melibiose transport system permease protein
MQFSVSQTVARRLAQPVSRIGRRASRVLSRVEPYVFILPALIFYVVFLALPVAGTLFISFLDWSGMSLLDMKWVGLKNYIDLAQDGVFWLALGHNVFFILVGSTAIVVLGLVLAVLLERGLRGSSFFRGVFFMPTVMSMVVVGIVFMLLLSPTLGLVNPILETLGLGRFKHAWLGDPNTALLTVIACHVWKSFGLAMFL